MSTREAPTPSTAGVRYPTVSAKLVGRDGNAFAVMGFVVDALRRAGVSAAEIAEYRRQSMSGDYNNLLATAMRWVNVS